MDMHSNCWTFPLPNAHELIVKMTKTMNQIKAEKVGYGIDSAETAQATVAKEIKKMMNNLGFATVIKN